MPALDFSVVVPFQNAGPHIERCITSLASQRYPADRYEVIMVANNSQDSSADIAARHPEVSLVQEARPGSYAARNRGIAQARGEIIAFTDADCVPDPDWLAQLGAAMGAHRDAGIALGGRAFAGKSRVLSMIAAYEETKAALTLTGPSLDALYGYANNMAVRRSLFDRLGPFAEIDRGADTLFVHQAAAELSGAVVRYVPEARVEHREIARSLDYYRKMWIYGSSIARLRAGGAGVRPLTTRERIAIWRRSIADHDGDAAPSLALLCLLTPGAAAYAAGRLHGRLRSRSGAAAARRLAGRSDGDGAGAPTVSVIVPTYQRRELVTQAVASVLTQTYRDFELIVVDDGSTDGTGEALAALDADLRYHWQPNRGQAAARNTGLRLAEGSIVAFLDSDDRWLPDHLAVVTEVLARLPEAVLVSTSPRHVIGGKSKPRKAYLFDPLPTHFLGNPVGYPSSLAVRRDALLEVGGFDERLLVGEDSELLMRLALRGPFGMLQRRTIVRRHSLGVMHWGRRTGASLDAFEYRASRAIEELEALSGPRAHELTTQAKGAAAFVSALRALDKGDDQGVAIALAQACRLLPELSREPELVAERLGLLPRADQPSDHLRHLTTMVGAWPDPAADTALFLRLCGALVALRQRRARQARALLSGWPVRPTPGFLKRAIPPLVRRARRGVDAQLHRAGDSVDLDAVRMPRPCRAP